MRIAAILFIAFCSHLQAIEASNLIGSWAGRWTARIGSNEASERVHFHFGKDGRCTFVGDSRSASNDGRYLIKRNEILLQFGNGAEDFMLLRNFTLISTSLQFEAVLPAVDNAVNETNLITLNSLQQNTATNILAVEKRSLAADLAEKFGVPFDLPLTNLQFNFHDRLAVQAFLEGFTFEILRADANTASMNARPQISLGSNRVTAVVWTVPNQDEFAAAQTRFLTNAIRSALKMVVRDAGSIVITTRPSGLGAFSMTSAPKLKPRYSDGKAISLNLLFEDCISILRERYFLTFDPSTLSQERGKNYRISSVMRPIPSGAVGIMAVERVSVELTSLPAPEGPASVSLLINQEQFRRRAASRNWQRVHARSERVLNAGGTNSVKLEADESLLNGVLLDISN